MRLAFIADARAEHTRHWLQYFVRAGDDLLLLSTFPGEPLPGVKTENLPGYVRAGDVFIKSPRGSAPDRKAVAGHWLMRSGLANRLYPLWQQLRAVEIRGQAAAARTALRQFKPDLVHALRIQNEGYVGGLAGHHPFVISSWGSDFVLMARRYPVHGLLTRWVMRLPDGFSADCRRDLRLAHAHGLPADRLTRCYPGNGGVELGRLREGLAEAEHRERLIVYNRGVSPFMRLETLFGAMRRLAARGYAQSGIGLVLVPAALVPAVDRMREKAGLLASQVRVCASVSRAELIRILQTAAVSVSPSVSDGTPVSMLEAMACGAFPVMSDLDSIREWITSGLNGLLFDPRDADGLAACLERALEDVALRRQAQSVNQQLVAERADYERVMPDIRRFYEQVAAARN